MGRKEKLLDQIKKNPKDRDFRELKTLLERYGFIVDESSGKGSHCPVYHSKYKDDESLRWTLSKRKPMKVYHAKEAVRLVEEVISREEN
ncbi:hypothetical protein [Rummeliibacillus sp. SL167]|uniref:hypothetical protein n=1 Tax=Rummeliibacillus sp. SL167 TaxID=2579792 RepID=UPI0011B560B2|nr:hypothetical protein [Rummeliibacillus sp. SL167]